MLIEFSVGNYRSFKETVTLSMVTANIESQYRQLDKKNVFPVDNELKLLKSVAVYGANASGKSNLVRAIGFMRWLMINSSKETQTAEDIRVEPFMLNTETELQPSFFEIVFLLDNKKYRYGFKANRKRIISEWLFYVPNMVEHQIFNRTFDENVDKIEILDAEYFNAEEIKRITRQNALFLSVSAQFNIEIAERILTWLTININIISGLELRGFLKYTVDCLEENHSSKQEVIQLIKKLDLGIKDLDVQEEIKIAVETIPKELPEELKSFISKRSYGKPVNTVHQQFDDQGEHVSMKSFSLDDQESQGTQKIVAIAGLLVDTLKTGKILIFDEFDASLHPLISKAIVDLFNSNETNTGNAQLIFMTHDTNLLSNKLFRKDQIWFTEKNKYGATDLYSLVEYKINDDDFSELDYIKGRYGAIPFIGDLTQIIGDNNE